MPAYTFMELNASHNVHQDLLQFNKYAFNVIHFVDNALLFAIIVHPAKLVIPLLMDIAITVVLLILSWMLLINVKVV